MGVREHFLFGQIQGSKYCGLFAVETQLNAIIIIVARTVSQCTIPAHGAIRQKSPKALSSGSLPSRLMTKVRCQKCKRVKARGKDLKKTVCGANLLVFKLQIINTRSESFFHLPGGILLSFPYYTLYQIQNSKVPNSAPSALHQRK
jgi:hypothetical protein